MPVVNPRRRRRASIRTSSTAGITHLDLENLVIALLAEHGSGWPNVLYGLGYRLHYFDATVRLIDATAPGGNGRIEKRPDAVAHHAARNQTLILECKTGADAGLGQIPEGIRNIPPSQWAEALGLPRGSMSSPAVKGVLVAEAAALGHRSDEISEVGASWLRVEQRTYTLVPDNLDDDRVGPAIGALPGTPWPRSFVPYSHELATLERAIGAIGPLILEAAHAGESTVIADELARSTHASVWRVSSDDRKKAWSRVAASALETLAKGSMRKIAVYDPNVRRLTLNGVRQGVPAGFRTMAALQQALRAEHRRTQRRRRRVPTRKVDQLSLGFFDEEA